MLINLGIWHIFGIRGAYLLMVHLGHQWGTTCGGGHVTPLWWFIHLWSPPGTQLSHMAPHSCLHATVATSWAMASTGQLNHVRVANRSETLSELGLAYLCM